MREEIASRPAALRFDNFYDFEMTRSVSSHWMSVNGKNVSSM